VLQAANPRDATFDTHAESPVRHRAVLAQVDVPVEGLGGQLVLLDAAKQKIQIMHALAAADDFTVTLGSQYVHA